MHPKKDKPAEPQIQAQLQKLEEECIKLTNTQSEAEVWTFSHTHLKADFDILGNLRNTLYGSMSANRLHKLTPCLESHTFQC